MKGIAIVGLVLCAVGLPSMLHESTLRLNYTNSVPVGLYHVQTEPAEYAGLCLPSVQLQPALNAGLDLGRGECADGREPILKTLYRASLDSAITLDQSGFTVGGRHLPNTAPKAFSKTGKRLTAYTQGTYTSGVWAISTYNRDSYDSRYFGPVDEKSVRFFAQPVFVF